jgi:hypothetical protein
MDRDRRKRDASASPSAQEKVGCPRSRKGRSRSRKQGMENGCKVAATSTLSSRPVDTIEKQKERTKERK